MALVLGVDSSTQSTKVEVRDADTGNLVASGAVPHPPTTPPRSEQAPSAWWNALVAAIGQTGQRDIAAMSIAGQQHGLVALDAAGAVLRPAKLWNDTESAKDAAALVRAAGADRWAEATGLVPVASFTVSKLAWLRRTEPERFERIGKILLPHDWLTYRLTGRYVTDRGDASGTGYWSPSEERWRPDLLRLVDDSWSTDEWLERLPEVLGPLDRADWAAAPVYELLGLKGRPMVAPGTGDNMAGALGIGLAPGEIAMSIGTSGTVYTVSEKPVADASGFVAGFADATGRYLPLVCTLNAGKVIDTVARLVGVDHAQLDEMALSVTGPDAPVLLPYLDGERTPNRPDASGVLTGLRSDTTREELAVAAHRGVACSLLDGLEAMRFAGVELGDEPIRLVGGGARSRAHRQILADLAGRPVEVPDGDEHVATGACVQAAAMVSHARPEEVAEAWGLGSGPVAEPRDCDADEIRAAYTNLRSRAPGLDRPAQD